MAQQEQSESVAALKGKTDTDPVANPSGSAAAACGAVGPGALAAVEASGTLPLPTQSERDAVKASGKVKASTLRKEVLRKDELYAPLSTSNGPRQEIDVVAHATVIVTSENPDHPIENAFDGNHGPGNTRWVANEDGEQTIILKFDSPLTLHGVMLEVEETNFSREQELALAISSDGGVSFRELRRQGFNFSPPQTTFEREVWELRETDVTHLRLGIKPDKSGNPYRATLTTLTLQGPLTDH